MTRRLVVCHPPPALLPARPPSVGRRRVRVGAEGDAAKGTGESMREASETIARQVRNAVRETVNARRI